MLAQAVDAAREALGLGEPAFTAAEAAGRTLSFEQLLDELESALAGEGVLAAPVVRAQTAREPDGVLSPREREMLALVVQGQTNRAIAEALFIASSTVKTHVTSLLTKLDADNRAQLAIIVIQRGLLSLALGDG
jgi:DNA-binding NarL/FixJ family response regulator